MNWDGVHADLTDSIIGCAIEVHRHLGPGLLEAVYESALCCELEDKGHRLVRQARVPVYYKAAQVLTYLRVTQLRVGLILNFNTVALRTDIKRLVR